MIIVLTGDGKGKTTASLGQMVRTVGRRKRALMIQFIKGPWKSGEDEFGEKFKTKNAKDIGDFEIRKRGRGFVGILGDTLPKEEHKRAACEALDEFRREMMTGDWQLIVLDEVNVAISLGLISIPDVLGAITDYPEEKLLILSGRGAPHEFIDRADLVTEMQDVKHPFSEGKAGEMGVEF